MRWLLNLILNAFGLVAIPINEYEDMKEGLRLPVTLHNKFVRSIEVEVEQKFKHLLEFMRGQKSSWFYGFHTLPALNLEEVAEGFSKQKPSAELRPDEQTITVDY